MHQLLHYWCPLDLKCRAAGVDWTIAATTAFSLDSYFCSSPYMSSSVHQSRATSATSFAVIRMCDMAEKQSNKFSNEKHLYGMHCINNHNLNHCTTVSPIYAAKPDKQHWSSNKTACLLDFANISVGTLNYRRREKNHHEKQAINFGYLQAFGVKNDNLVNCGVHKVISWLSQTWKRGRRNFNSLWAANNGNPALSIPRSFC